MTRPTTGSKTRFTPIDDRPPASVRALILARTSSTGGSADDVQSQVEQSQAFVAQMGWTCIHPDDPYRFVETKTGVRQVRRPVLDSVIALAQAGAVDVIVCLSAARIAREKTQRYSAIGTAQRFGVEFRFAARAPTAGRYPGGTAGLLEQLKDDLFDEQEATAIVARLTPGKLARYTAGLPHGGGAGPDYGYVEGERRFKMGRDGRKGRPLGCLTWAIDEPKAAWVRWLFDMVDTTEVCDLSYRKLGLRLEALGAPTATGRGHWNATQVSRLLHNGKYGGQGVNLRYQSEWGSYVNQTTGEVFEEVRIGQRDPSERYPISVDACPPIIAPDQWARVQAKVALLDDHPHRRFGARRTAGDTAVPQAAWDMLLVGEFIRCRHCGKLMTRYWTRHRTEPHYQCPTASARPDVCKRHTIAAHYADGLALKLLARGLTSPEHILALADAAQAQVADATAEVALADARLESARERLGVLATEHHKLTTALVALGALAGMEEQVGAIRGRLAALDEEQADLAALQAQAASRRGSASERVAFLRQMFTAREEVFDFASGMLSETGAPVLSIGATCSTAQAAALLGCAEADLAARVPIITDRLNDGTVEEVLLTRDVVEQLLLALPRDELRALLRRLQAVVLISRPRPQAERGGKWTPPEDRVALQLLRQVEVRTDATQVSTSV